MSRSEKPPLQLQLAMGQVPVSARGADEEPIQPFALELKAKAHRPVYRMHRYFARRPHNLFAALIEHFTEPGDVVLDPFMGGGVTLVEATERGRRAIGFDTNPLASFITRTELESLDIEDYRRAVERVGARLTADTANLYSTTCRACQGDARVEWYEHSLVTSCSACSISFPISSAEKRGLGTWACPACTAPVKAAPTACAQTLLVQMRVNCERCGANVETPSPNDLDRQSELDDSREAVLDDLAGLIPDAEIPDNNMQRESALHKKGIVKFHQFFTTRQLIAVAAIRQAIEDDEPALRPHLLLAFSSTLRFANRMVTRNPAWRGDRPLEWVGTGFWLPTVFLDANLETEFKRRAAAVLKGKLDFNGPQWGGEATCAEVAEGMPGAAWAVETRSSASTPLADNSVDAIVTDPPYGSYVHYADMSNFWNVWLPSDVVAGAGGVIDATEEAVVARKRFPGAKDTTDYGNLLQAVFEECSRVLKPGRAMVLTFNNREPRAWSALLVAAMQAGFQVPDGGVHFQAGVENYRHTARTRRAGSVHGDFVFTFVKPSTTKPTTRLVPVPDPLAPEEIDRRLHVLVEGRSITTEDLMREFYQSLIPDLLLYLETRVTNADEAKRLLHRVDELDLFNSERREKLASVIAFHDGLWSARKAG